MKRVLFALLLSTLTLCMSAQGWIGGSFGLNFEKAKTGNVSVNTTTVDITPEFGWQVTDEVAIGAEFDVNWLKIGGGKTTLWGFGPFVRYNVWSSSNITLFGEAAMHYVNLKEGNASMGGYCFQIRPGIAIDLIDNISLLGRMKLFNYSHYSKDGVGISDAGLSITTDLSVGIVYKF